MSTEVLTPPDPIDPPPSRRWWVLGASVVVVLLLAGLVGWLGGRLAASPISQRAEVTTGEGTCDAVAVSDEVLPAVVTVALSTDAGGGTGSGEIVRADGYIVTNNHVISGAASGGSISVLYSSGERAAAELVGRDPRSDLAVLKVDASDDLPTVPWGSSADLLVGQPVVALGAPLGLSGSVTSGIVSALGRTVPVPGDNGVTALLANSIQTDAAINPGNSGGALVNCAGTLVGINTAIATVPNSAGQSGGGSVGIGFAIPANFAESIVDQIIDTGKASYPYFGIAVAPIPDAIANKFDVPEGLFVTSVVEGGPSATAGLRAGDILTDVDGRPATSFEVLTHAVMTNAAGDSVDVKFVRDGTSKSATVTLGDPLP